MLYLWKPLHFLFVEVDSNVADLGIAATVDSNAEIFYIVSFGGIDEDGWAALTAFCGNAIGYFSNLLV